MDFSFHPVQAKLDDLIKKIREFRLERDWDQYHSPKNLAMALIAEAGELVEHFQWLTEKESRSLPPDKIAAIEEEVGDVLIYLANLCDKLAIDPIGAAHDKLEKNRGKYPVSLVRGKSSKYNEYK